MNRYKNLVASVLAPLFLASFLFLPTAARAAGETLVIESATAPRACATMSATAAVANTVTLTITPPNGFYVYLCGWDIIVANDATGAVVATNLSFTSTNIGGWALKYSMVGTANTNGLIYSTPAGMLVKSAAPGVAVTLVSPASNAHATYSFNAYYYIAP